MKKRIIMFLLIIMALCTSIGVGATYSRTITGWFYNISININGHNAQFNSAPFIYNNYVYVPINDLLPQLGYKYTWDNNTKTIIVSNPTHSNDINLLQSEIDRKNMEIMNMKFQLSQQELYNRISDNSPTFKPLSPHSLKDVEKILRDNFDVHENENRTMRFKDFHVYRYTNEIQIKMYGDFDKSYNVWKNKDTDDFNDFIEDLCEEVTRTYKKDVIVKVYDDDDDQIAKFNYDMNDERLYSEESDDVKDKLNQLEEDLEDDYDEYADGSKTLEFKKYVLKQMSDDSISCKIYGSFEEDDSDWINRDKDEFKDFIKDICEEISDEVDEDIDVYVYDDDNNKLDEFSWNRRGYFR